MIWFALYAATMAGSVTGEVHFFRPTPDESVVITAESGNHWREGAYEVWWLQGDCQLQQGRTRARGKEAVIWIERSDSPARQPHKMITYSRGT